MLSRVMVEQDVLPDFAAEAEVKVQEPRASSSAAGAAATSAEPRSAAAMDDLKKCMVNEWMMTIQRMTRDLINRDPGMKDKERRC
jgi:hypothetical protein